MIPRFNKIHNRFKLNSYHFNFEELKDVAYNFIKEGESYEKNIGDFLLQWLDNNHYIIVNTSGSTGQPKAIKLNKQAMVNSAIATGNYFNLQPGDKALHCLPSQYIAGKMMLVRAMILGLEIDCVLPNIKPKFNNEKEYHFCAMIPLQLQHVIHNASRIKTLIIGGSSISKPLLKHIKNSKFRCFETYGMTETATHIAVKQLQTKDYKGETVFKALPEVKFSTDNRNCLIIHAPNVVDEAIITNDSIDLKSPTTFQWLGRFDNVINSGGIKLCPEQIERKLQSVINERFIIAGEKDESLGEKLILIIENPTQSVTQIKQHISTLKNLTKHQIPKEIYTTPQCIETANGKIHRHKTLASVLGAH